MDYDPVYRVGERVKVLGWVGKDYGIIKELKVIYHNRLGDLTWGYRVGYEKDGPGLTMDYVPEGYLRKTKQK